MLGCNSLPLQHGTQLLQSQWLLHFGSDLARVRPVLQHSLQEVFSLVLLSKLVLDRSESLEVSVHEFRIDVGFADSVDRVHLVNQLLAVRSRVAVACQDWDLLAFKAAADVELLVELCQGLPFERGHVRRLLPES